MERNRQVTLSIVGTIPPRTFTGRVHGVHFRLAGSDSATVLRSVRRNTRTRRWLKLSVKITICICVVVAAICRVALDDEALEGARSAPVQKAAAGGALNPSQMRY